MCLTLLAPSFQLRLRLQVLTGSSCRVWQVSIMTGDQGFCRLCRRRLGLQRHPSVLKRLCNLKLGGYRSFGGEVAAGSFSFLQLLGDLISLRKCLLHPQLIAVSCFIQQCLLVIFQLRRHVLQLGLTLYDFLDL